MYFYVKSKIDFMRISRVFLKKELTPRRTSSSNYSSNLPVWYLSNVCPKAINPFQAPSFIISLKRYVDPNICDGIIKAEQCCLADFHHHENKYYVNNHFK